MLSNEMTSPRLPRQAGDPIDMVTFALPGKNIIGQHKFARIDMSENNATCIK